MNLLRNLAAVAAMLRDEVAGWLMSTAVEQPVDKHPAGWWSCPCGGEHP